MRTYLLAVFVVVSYAPSTVAQWMIQKSGTKERLRGVSAVSKSVAWASGNKGTCVRTIDGGNTWVTLKVPDADPLDFRDVEAFDSKTAYILSIGTGEKSQILKTVDGGRHWILQFKNSNPRAFFDEMAFWDRENGIAVSDAVDGILVIVKTTDGGLNWNPIASEGIPPALPGEGAFAASGSSISVAGKSTVWIGTGVNTARVYRSTDRGQSWTVTSTPIRSINESSGIFSVSFFDAKTGVIVGGDYKKENEANDNCALTIDGGTTWKLGASKGFKGFRSAVAYISKNIVLAVGPSGTDLSTDGGNTWKETDTLGFHAVSCSKDGKAVWGVGEKGRIAKSTLILGNQN